MHRIANTAFIIFGLVLGYRLATLHGILMAQLRERHREEWQRLGSPHSAWGGWTFSTLGFLLSRRYQQLHDSTFSAQASRFRVGFFIWTVGSLAISILLLSWSSWSH
jgi:hypothetical protein